MRRTILTLTALFSFVPMAGAAVVFDTLSVAVQTIESPLFGNAPIVLRSRGTQRFSLDFATGVANVTSDFKGTDLPDPLTPGGFLSYDLYNTPSSTTGTVTQNGSGTYDIIYTLLFELAITSGSLAGQTFETQQFATFAALGLPVIPFGDGTVFSDSTPPDTVVIFAKTSLPGVYNAGDPVGTSSGRTVTVLRVVPETSSLALAGFGAICLLAFRRFLLVHAMSARD